MGHKPIGGFSPNELSGAVKRAELNRVRLKRMASAHVRNILSPAKVARFHRRFQQT